MGIHSAGHAGAKTRAELKAEYAAAEKADKGKATAGQAAGRGTRRV